MTIIVFPLTLQLLRHIWFILSSIIQHFSRVTAIIWFIDGAYVHNHNISTKQGTDIRFIVTYSNNELYFCKIKENKRSENMMFQLSRFYFLRLCHHKTFKKNLWGFQFILYSLSIFYFYSAKVAFLEKHSKWITWFNSTRKLLYLFFCRFLLSFVRFI